MSSEDETALQRMDLCELMQLVDPSGILEDWRRGNIGEQLTLPLAFLHQATANPQA